MSKELEFYADFKYLSFIKFNLTHQRLRTRENLPDFWKKGKHPLKDIESWWKSHNQIQHIREPYCRGFKRLSEKNVELCIFFCQKNCQCCVFICFSFHGWSYWPSGPGMSREDLFGRKLKVLVPFLSDQTNWMATRHPPTPLFFSQSYPIKILR